ncbi:MAG: STAS domain-containing protein [Clostridia bacterium]|nr:STAS domain-containing protein [Clostridia bacterium]
MKITKSLNGTELTVALQGELDTLTAPELEKELKEGLNSLTAITFDFAELDYISSAGLRVLLMAHHGMSFGGTIKVINANEIVREVFEVTGFTDIITVE